MAHYSEVGQVPESGDCGYFCGYVVGLMKASTRTPSRMYMEQIDVFDARDRHLTRAPTGRPTPMSHSLGVHEMPRFLAGRSVGGYQVRHAQRGGLPLTTPDQVLRAVNPILRRPDCYGIILPQGTLLGHYVVILGGTAERWIMYDPAGTPLEGGGRTYSVIQLATAVAPMIIHNATTRFIAPA